VSKGEAVVCGDVGTGVYYAVEGADCASDGDAACSLDQAINLECQRGVWVAGRHCPPSTCARTADGIQCANGGSSVGDLCSFSAGAVVCSTDLTKILQCTNGRTTVLRDCGSGHCTQGANGLSCQ
jgi:hypothetical protein